LVNSFIVCNFVQLIKINIMTVSVNRNGLSVTDIYNESMANDAEFITKQSGCEYEYVRNRTKILITGTQEQLNKFINLWNKFLKQ
jgi:hypothetical protein